MVALLMEAGSTLILGGTAAFMKSSIALYPSLDSIYAVSLSSGPMCLSGKVSRAPNGDEEAFAVARVRATTWRKFVERTTEDKEDTQRSPDIRPGAIESTEGEDGGGDGKKPRWRYGGPLLNT